MAATIKIKNSSTANAKPTSSDLVQGELAINVTDKKIFTEDSGGNIVELGANFNGFKNRIINGAMMIDQRNAGASVTPSGGAVVYTLDRFSVFEDTDGACSIQQVSDAPAGFVNSLKFTATTADASLGSTQRVVVQQRIEGSNIADLAWGGASASTVTVSFWVKSSLTGSFGGTLANSAGNRAYPFSYTISSANTWEQKTVTITGDTTGTWLTTTGTGIILTFGLGVGSTYSGTANAWAASDLNSVTGAVSVIGTLNATWQVTGVQLERGSTATSFDYRPYGTELALCQRYGQINPAVDLEINALTPATNVANINLPVTMRTSPSVTTQPTFTLAGTTSNSLAGLSASTVLFVAVPSANGYVRIRCSASGFLSAEL